MLYICSTPYHVLVALCRIVVNKEDADIVICSDILDGKGLTERLNASDFVKRVFFFDEADVALTPLSSMLSKLFLRPSRTRRAVEKVLNIDVFGYRKVCIFHDVILLGRYLQDVGRDFLLLEDSHDFFKTVSQSYFGKSLPQKTIYYKLRKLLNVGYFPLGQSKYAIGVEVNSREGLEIEHRCIIECSKERLFTSISAEVFNDMYMLFSYGASLPCLSQCNNILILTQPLWEEGLLPDKESQLKLYGNMAKNYYEQGHSVFLKPHPRDTVDYIGLSNIERVMSAHIPIELLFLTGQARFKEIATVFSSAAKFPLINCNLNVMGIESLKKFQSKEGDY